MNRKLLLIPLLLIIALLAAGPAAAQVDDSIDTSLTVMSGEHTVGDPIQLQLVVNHPANSHVIIPDLESEWGNFIVHSQSPPESIVNEDGSKTTTQMIDVRLFAPGDFSTLPLSITVAGADGQLSEVDIDPISVSISSVLVDGDEALRDIKPQADLPYLLILPWLIAAAVLVVIALVVVWLIRRRKASLVESGTDPRLPHEVALDRLARLEKLDLPNEGRFKEHYTLVSDCIRIYVERAFHITVMERTTAEIQRSIKQTAISPTVVHQFISLLDESDLVKFSKFTPDVSDARQALLNGRSIVEETMLLNQPDSLSDSPGSITRGAGDAADPTLSVNGNYRQTEVRA
jgi:hypothetical protein